MNYIIYNEDGVILRNVECPPGLANLQAKEGEFIMEGTANDATQKIVDSKVVDKTTEEIEADNPTPHKIPAEKQPAYITKEQWQSVLERIARLEIKDGGKT